MTTVENSWSAENIAKVVSVMTSSELVLFVVFATGAVDELNSPSARLTVGRVMKAGTGSFDVVVPLAV